MADSIINVLVKLKIDLEGAVAQIKDTAAKMGAALEGAGQGKSTDALSESLGALDDAAKDAEESLTPLGAAAKWVASHFKSLQAGIEFVTKGFLALQSVRTLKDFADTAARAETLGIVLNQVGKNAGYTKTQINDADEAIQELGITAASSRESLTHLIQSGLNVSLAGPLARAAQDLAVIAGWNSSDTFQRLIVNIQQMDAMGLRFMGIMVNKEAAIAAGAQTVGRALTDSEKKLAFANAVLLEAAKLAGTYEAAMASVGKQLTSTPRYVEEAKEAIGNSLLPVYTQIVVAINHTLKAFTEFYEAIQSKNASAGALITPLTLLASGVKLVGDVISAVFGFMEEHSAGIAVFSRAISQLAVVIGILWGVAKVTPLVALVNGFALATTGVVTFSTAVFSATAGMQVAFAGMVSGLRAVGVAMLGLLANPATWVFVALSAAIYGAMEAYRAFSDAQTKAMVPDQIKAYAQAQQDLTTNLTTLVAVQTKNAALNQKIEAAKIDGKPALMASLRAELAAGKEEEAQLIKKQAAISRVAVALEAWMATNKEFMNDDQLDAVKALDDSLAAITEQAKNATDATKNFATAETALGVTTTGLSKSFTDLQANVSTVVRGIEADLATGLPLETVNAKLKELRATYLKLAEGAKSPEEIAAALADLSASALKATVFVDNLKKSLTAKGDTALIKELDELMAGFLGLQKVYADHRELGKALFDNEIQDADKLDKAISDLGLAGVKATTGFSGFKSTFKQIGDSFVEVRIATTGLVTGLTEIPDRIAKGSQAGKLLAESLRQVKDSADKTASAMAEMEGDLSDLKKKEAERKKLVSERVDDVKAWARGILTIERETALEQIAIQKKVYEAERTKLADAIGLWKQYASKVLELKESIAALDRKGEEDILDIKRADMSEEELLLSKKKEARDLYFKQNAALVAGDYKLALEYGNKRIALEKELAIQKNKESGVVDLTKYNAALSAQKAIYKEQEQDATKAANAQKKQIGDLTSSIEKLSKSLSGLNEKQLNLKAILEIPPNMVADAVKKIPEEEKTVELTVVFKEPIAPPITWGEVARGDVTLFYKKLQELFKEPVTVPVMPSVEEGNARFKEALKDLFSGLFGKEDMTVPVTPEVDEGFKAKFDADFKAITDVTSNLPVEFDTTAIQGVVPQITDAFKDIPIGFASTSVSDLKASVSAGLGSLAVAITEAPGSIEGILERARGVMNSATLYPRVEISNPSLSQMLNKIKSSVESMNLNVTVTTAVKKAYAFGGYISGTGNDTSDNIDIKASPGEYMVKAPSVRKWGLPFMHAINEGVLPLIQGFASGGLIQGLGRYSDAMVGSLMPLVSPYPSILGYAGGGPIPDASPQRDVVDVNLNVGKQSFALAGERSQVQALVHAIKSVGRSL